MAMAYSTHPINILSTSFPPHIHIPVHILFSFQQHPIYIHLIHILEIQTSPTCPTCPAFQSNLIFSPTSQSHLASPPQCRLHSTTSQSHLVSPSPTSSNILTLKFPDLEFLRLGVSPTWSFSLETYGEPSPPSGISR